jgi:hypothetical protein
VVGVEVSTGLPSAGIPLEHEPSGFAFGVEPPPELDPVVEPDADPELDADIAPPAPLAPLPWLPPEPVVVPVVVPETSARFAQVADARSAHAARTARTVVGAHVVTVEGRRMNSPEGPDEHTPDPRGPMILQARGGCRGSSALLR